MVKDSNSQTAYMICDLGFEITDQDVLLKNFNEKLELTNLTINDGDITVETGWNYSKANDTTYNFTHTDSVFKVGYHKIATIKFNKINYAEECLAKYIPSFTVGDLKCFKTEDSYYDASGKPTDKLTYQKQCEVNICVQLPDGTYWGKNGTQLKNKEAFDAECGEKETKHYCEVVGQDYYDKNGEKTTKEKFELQCKNHYCTFIPDTTNSCETANTDGELNSNKYWCNENKVIEYYFNKSGENVKKSEYEEDCLKHVCSIVNGHYYDKDGKKVETEAEFNASCKPIVVEEKHKCEIVDNKYYDKDGNVVTEEEYNKQCKSCTIIDDKYYDKDGNEVSENEYNKQCKKRSCEIIDDTYYDKDGNVVSKDEYTKACPLSV